MKKFFSRTPPNPEGVMSLVDHLRELRYRLIMSLIAISCMAILGYLWYAQSFTVHWGHVYWRVASSGELLSKPYCDIPSPPRAQITKDGSCRLLSLSPFDQFFLRIKVGVITGTIIACPIWFYHLWKFIAPGLKKNEKRYTSFFVITSAGLFLLGAVIAYLVLPEAFNFLLRVGDNIQVTAMQGDKYFSFVVNILIIFGVSFELPVVIIALNFVRILSSKTLMKHQRISIFGLFVFAAIVTPGQDAFSMLALAVSLTILFELAVVICIVHDKLMQQKDTIAERENYMDLPADQAAPLESIRALPLENHSVEEITCSEPEFSVNSSVNSGQYSDYTSSQDDLL